MKIEELANEVGNKIIELRKSGLCIGETDTAHEVRKNFVMPLMKIHRELELLKELDEII